MVRRSAAFAAAALATGLLAGCAGNKAPGPETRSTPQTAAPAPAAPTRPAPAPEPVVVQPLAPERAAPIAPTPAPPSVPATARRLTFASIPGWTEGDHAPALAALRLACEERIADRAFDAPMGGVVLAGQPIYGTGADWSPICREARRTRPEGTRAFFEKWFEPISVAGAGDAGGTLYTAYFEPELAGSRVRGGPYRTPIHGVPSDLRKGVPYFDRAAIVDGALDGRGLELFWLADPVEAFFLQIQGSGRIRLPDGTVARVGYAGKNNRPYKAIGRVLVDAGIMPLEEVSTQSIKAWIAANPDQRDALLNANPSYVFFKERPELADPSLGPIGSAGVPLPALRAIAIDPKYHPLGVPAWTDFDSPVGPIRRLVVALDTGGAIKGAGRADFFFGSGDAAGEAAGATRARGRLVTLAPTAALRRAFRAGS